jgi:hypothetical protein
VSRVFSPARTSLPAPWLERLTISGLLAAMTCVSVPGSWPQELYVLNEGQRILEPIGRKEGVRSTQFTLTDFVQLCVQRLSCAILLLTIELRPVDSPELCEGRPYNARSGLPVLSGFRCRSFKRFTPPLLSVCFCLRCKTVRSHVPTRRGHGIARRTMR